MFEAEKFQQFCCPPPRVTAVDDPILALEYWYRLRWCLLLLYTLCRSRPLLAEWRRCLIYRWCSGAEHRCGTRVRGLRHEHDTRRRLKISRYFFFDYIFSLLYFVVVFVVRTSTEGKTEIWIDLELEEMVCTARFNETGIQCV